MTTLPYPSSKNPHPRLPAGTLRDIVGVARCLRRAWTAAGTAPERLAALDAVGADLVRALGLARRHPPGTLPHWDAIELAESAVARLGELVAEQDAGALVRVTREQIRRR